MVNCICVCMQFCLPVDLQWPAKNKIEVLNIFPSPLPSPSL